VFKSLALSLGARVNGNKVESIIDIGASLSVVSQNLVNPRDINRAGATPVQVANGETFFSLGTTQLEVRLGNRTVQQQALVLPTSAIPAVLGLEFLMKPPCQGILTSPEPCRFLFDHQENPLRTLTAFQDVSNLYKYNYEIVFPRRIFR